MVAFGAQVYIIEMLGIRTMLESHGLGLKVGDLEFGLGVWGLRVYRVFRSWLGAVWTSAHDLKHGSTKNWPKN